MREFRFAYTKRMFFNTVMRAYRRECIEQCLCVVWDWFKWRVDSSLCSDFFAELGFDGASDEASCSFHKGDVIRQAALEHHSNVVVTRRVCGCS